MTHIDLQARKQLLIDQIMNTERVDCIEIFEQAAKKAQPCECSPTALSLDELKIALRKSRIKKECVSESQANEMIRSWSK